MSATRNASIPAGIPQYALSSYQHWSFTMQPSSFPFATLVRSLLTSISYKRKKLPGLQQRLSNLYLSAPIPDCTPYMRPQLNPFPQSSQHDQI